MRCNTSVLVNRKGEKELRMRLTAALAMERRFYVAPCLSVEVTSRGETLDDALAKLKQAPEPHFADAA